MLIFHIKKILNITCKSLSLKLQHWKSFPNFCWSASWCEEEAHSLQLWWEPWQKGKGALQTCPGAESHREPSTELWERLQGGSTTSKNSRNCPSEETSAWNICTEGPRAEFEWLQGVIPPTNAELTAACSTEPVLVGGCKPLTPSGPVAWLVPQGTRSSPDCPRSWPQHSMVARLDSAPQDNQDTPAGTSPQPYQTFSSHSPAIYLVSFTVPSPTSSFMVWH